MAVVNRNASIEFIVRPKQDLYLEGSLRRLPRVSSGEPYPCQMQKNQNFSCLFRHYAKHNGLRKEDLVFSFVDELLADQTPETVHLMPQDEISVEHRPEKVESDAGDSPPTENSFILQFKKLLASGQHSDATFIVGEHKVEFNVHKAVLSARSEYFEAMFREGGMAESLGGSIYMEHDDVTFRRMLEFIYSNNVEGLDRCSPDELTQLLVLANKFLLQDLRVLCEKFSTSIIRVENIGKLLLLSAGHNASVLRTACAKFVQDNKVQLFTDGNFRKEIESSPELGLLLFESSIPSDQLQECESPSTDRTSKIKCDSDDEYNNENGDEDEDNIRGNTSRAGSKRRRISEPQSADVDSALMNGNNASSSSNSTGNSTSSGN